MLLAGIAGTVLLSPLLMRGADNDLPIYFENSTLVLKTQTVNRISYLPLADIVRQLGLPFTNDTVQEMFTVRGTNSQVVLTRNSAAISVNNQIALLPNPVLHDNGTWLVPYEFLPQGLSRITGTEFRRRAGTPRVFAGAVKPAELTMNAQFQGSLTRLTLRTSTPVTLEMRRETAQHRTILAFVPKVIDPARETLDYKDRLVSSIDFSDSDGMAKIIVETTDEVGDVRILSADENRVHFIDFIRKTEVTGTSQTPAEAPTAAGTASAGKQDPAAAPTGAGAPVTGGIRVIVLDPGHGGTDTGAMTLGVLEKDLTLIIARKLRATLQSRLGATVLLTRDSDVPLTSEARASVANNNQADLFLSLHIGYSANQSDLGSSVYVIKDNFAASLLSGETGRRLFLPWYLGYRPHRPSSVQVAGLASEELSNAFPGWNFPLRNGPVAVLASAAMPAMLLEIGNLANPTSTQALLDNTFQTKLSVTIAAAIERFSAMRPAAK